jgi:hypothetical protein
MYAFSPTPISPHCETINIYRPAPLSAEQISNNTMGCKQQSMGNREVLYDLYAECLSVMSTDCLDVSNSSSSNSRKVIMCSGLKMLMDILIWSVGGS